MVPPSPSRRSRYLRRGGWALSGLAALYLLGANLFLRPQIGVPLVNRKPAKLRMQWSGGWTVIPGVVHLEGLELEVRAGEGSWHLEADRARGRIALLDLVGRRFRVASAEASGVVFVAQLPPGATPGATTYLPDPLEAEARRASGEGELIPEAPPAGIRRREDGPGGWWIVLEDVEVREVRELSLGPYRFLGPGTASGGMSIKTRGGPLEVPGARLVLEPGQLEIEGRHAARLDRLEMELRMDPARREQRRGRTSWSFISGRLEAVAPEARLGAIDFLFRRIPTMHISGEGDFRLVALVDRGVLQSGTSLEASGNSEVGYLGYILNGVVEIGGAVTEQGGGEDRAAVDLRFEEFQLREEGAQEAHVLGRGATIRLAADDLDLAAPKPEIEAVVDIPDSRVPRLTYYNRFLPPGSGAEILAGEGTFAGRLQLEAPADSWSGELSLEGKGVRLDIQGSLLEGDLKLDAVLPSGSIHERRADLSGTRLRVDRARFIPRGGSPSGRRWWARLELPRGEMTLGSPLALESTFRATLRDTEPLVALFRKDKKSPQWLRHLLTVEDVTGSGEITFQSQYVEARKLAFAAGEHIEVKGHLRLVEKDLAALLFCRYRKLSAGVEILGDERNWDLVGSRKWFREKERGWPGAPPPR